MEASEGAVSLFGGSTLDAEAKAKIAYLPEKFEPPSFLSGLEFVKFSLDLYKRPFSEEAVMQAADRVSLSRSALKRRVNTYSKGMRQKTGLMGTWLTDCPLLILDEPMSGLDPRARVLVKDEILSCKKRGMTVFLSSHILADMDEICGQHRRHPRRPAHVHGHARGAERTNAPATISNAPFSKSLKNHQGSMNHETVRQKRRQRHDA